MILLQLCYEFTECHTVPTIQIDFDVHMPQATIMDLW